MTTAIEKVGNVAIDYAAVLNTLKLNPKDPNVQALILVCQQYELDPVLKHMVLIQGAAYITHKGLWHMAHRSGLLDGEDILEQGETDREWFAKVAIYRKDWNRPITMTGRYPKSATNKQYGPEMAVTRAECLVLRRMFDVAVPVQEEINWPDNDRGAGASTRKDEGDVPERPTVTRAALNAPDVSDIQPGSEFDGPTVVSQSKPRTFPAPNARKTTAELDAEAKALLDKPADDEFNDADRTLCSPQELKALRDEIDALDLEAASDLADAWKAAGLPSVKNKRTYDKAAFETAMGLVLDAKEAMDMRLANEAPFVEGGDAA